MSKEMQRLPIWTWLVPFLLMVVGDQVSLLFKYSVSSYFYLPAAMGIVLIHWWGPARVIPAVFVITCLNNYFYGFDNLFVWIGFGLGDSIGVFLSWLLFNKLAKGKFWLPDTKNTVSFLVLGMSIPILFYVTNWQMMYLWDKKMVWEDFINQFRMDFLEELIVSSVMVIPALYYFTPMLSKRKLTYKMLSIEIQNPFRGLSVLNWIEIISTCLSAYLFTTFFGFEDFWFILGVISLYIAIRFGFGLVLLINILFFSLTYLLPALNHPLFSANSSFKIYPFFGYFLLYLFSTITGRVITDLMDVKSQLFHQNNDLAQINRELDHFVYSVSHDLSAPLKSIRGLINISRLDVSPNEQNLYLDRMETSVSKLEYFIKEVLDYSRSNREELRIDKVNIVELVKEVFESLQPGEEGSTSSVLEVREDSDSIWYGDSGRLKIIINNLLNNAIKYQKKNPDHIPVIRVSYFKKNGQFNILFEDNGEGIRPDLVNKIFKMFFRGHSQSSGSGLGLYIALEAARKLNGAIRVSSEYGKGSVFTLVLPIANE
jgi:signal transduction histidine kinase